MTDFSPEPDDEDDGWPGPRLESDGALQAGQTGMRQVAHVQSGAPVLSDAAELMQVIRSAAADPNVDVDKFERLLALSERVQSHEAERAFNVAMNDTQTELQPIGRDAKGDKDTRYASFIAIDRAVRPIYAAHGFSLSFDTSEGAPADHVRVVCYVAHRDGFSRTYHVDIPADGKGAKGGDVMTKTHATGSAMTYGQRYLLRLIFNLAVGDDDDGRRAGSSREDDAVRRTAEKMVADINMLPRTREAFGAWKAANSRHVRDLPVQASRFVMDHFNRCFAHVSQPDQAETEEAV